MKVICGPIVGKVTSSTARILVEVDLSGEVKIKITNSDGEFTESSKLFRRCEAAPIEMKLPPATEEAGFNLYEYTVHAVEDDEVIGYGSFRSIPDDYDIDRDGEFTIAVASCNRMDWHDANLADYPHTDLWGDLAANAQKPDGPKLLLHIGDQIYADAKDGIGPPHKNAYGQAMELVKNTEQDKWDSIIDDVRELYRKEYRRTWMHPATQQTLANISNLMIFDDHEIFDNYADDLSIDTLDETLPQNFVAARAREMIYVYQRQLHEDVDIEHIKQYKTDHHLHTFGDVGIVMLDGRGARGWNKKEDTKKPYLGEQQWKDLHAAFDSNGLFKDCKCLFLANPVPVILMSPLLAKHAAKKMPDVMGEISYKPYVPEQLEYLNMIDEWAGEKDDRTVTLIGGDIHHGGYTHIEAPSGRTYKQVISSAICNQVLKVHQLMFSRLYIGSDHNIKPEAGWTYQHYRFLRHRNYARLTFCYDNAEPDLMRNKLKRKVSKIVSHDKTKENSTSTDVEDPAKQQTAAEPSEQKVSNGSADQTESQEKKRAQQANEPASRSDNKQLVVVSQHVYAKEGKWFGCIPRKPKKPRAGILVKSTDPKAYTRCCFNIRSNY